MAFDGVGHGCAILMNFMRFLHILLDFVRKCMYLLPPHLTFLFTPWQQCK